MNRPLDFQSEVGEVFGEIGGELPAKFGRSFSSCFCWENRQKHFTPKLHRKFHHQTSLRGSGLWRALKIATNLGAAGRSLFVRVLGQMVVQLLQATVTMRSPCECGQWRAIAVTQAPPLQAFCYMGTLFGVDLLVLTFPFCCVVLA